jgi:hypothetical protein
MLLGSILVFETSNAIRGGIDGKGRILRFDAARIAGMVERGAGYSAAVAWHPAAAVIAFIPRLAYAVTLPPDRRGEHLVQAVTGLVLCAAAYAGVAMVTYLTHGTYPTGALLSVMLGP